jgi:hypothetical protein
MVGRGGRDFVTSRARYVFVLAGLLTLVATAALRLVTPSDAAVSSTLHATVGPAFDITLTFDDGSPVTALPAGSYRVVVSDVTTDHNFHLYGPGVEQETGVDFTGSTSWNVTFSAGSRYQFVCDVHADSMFGRFDAGTVAADSGGGGGGGVGTSKPSGSVVSSKRAVSIATLVAGLDSAGKLRLTLKGKAVKSLAAGRYTFLVTDPSKNDTLSLRRTGAVAKALTTRAFVGKKSVAVTLTAGEWKLYLSGKPSTPFAFRVAT